MIEIFGTKVRSFGVGSEPETTKNNSKRQKMKQAKAKKATYNSSDQMDINVSFINETSIAHVFKEKGYLK